MIYHLENINIVKNANWDNNMWNGAGLFQIVLSNSIYGAVSGQHI